MIKREPRDYRRIQRPEGFKAFELIAGESDVWVAVPQELYSEELREELLNHLIAVRSQILAWGEKQGEFLTSLEPVAVPPFAPKVVREMAERAEAVGVGPMAGVAGAVNLSLAEKLRSLGVGRFLLENGGDLFVSLNRPTVVALLPPKGRAGLGLELPPGSWGVSTSSSYIGHSLSFGRTQLATALCPSPVLSDCCATYLGNSRSVEEAKERAERLFRELSVSSVVLIDGKLVAVGPLKFVRLI
jgi:ApbE superfamily uncharacterized protein (UPF0280 family)